MTPPRTLWRDLVVVARWCAPYLVAPLVFIMAVGAAALASFLTGGGDPGL